MNLALLKNTIKKNWKLVLIFMSVLCMYLSIIIILFDPADPESIKELFSIMPPQILAMFNMSLETMTSPLHYTASTFFGLMVMAFTMVFYVIQSSRLVAKPVDNNSLAYVLTMPISRTKFILTQAIYLICSIFTLFLAMLIIGSILLFSMGNFNFWAYFNLICITFLLNTMIAMLSFMVSVMFCDSKKGFSLAVSVPILLLIISMLGGAGGDSTKFLTKISPFSWIDSVGIVSGTVNTWWMYIVFIFLLLSVISFKKKRLSL